MKKYVDTGQVLFGYRALPLDLHKSARGAAEAAECAGRQGRFWEMHDRLFQNPGKLDANSIKIMASAVGLTAGSFESCLGGQAAAKVQEDIASAKALNIRATPTFLLGTVLPDGSVKVSEVIPGAISAERMGAALEKLLGTVRPDW
jgi:protein-disulfide isomerase